MNQPLDPEGQRRSQGSCDPLEYQQTGSNGIEERRQRKALGLSGRQNSHLLFPNSPSVQAKFPSVGNDWLGVPLRTFTRWHTACFFHSHCKSEQHYSSKSSQMEVTFALHHAACLTDNLSLAILYANLMCSLSRVDSLTKLQKRVNEFSSLLCAEFNFGELWCEFCLCDGQSCMWAVPSCYRYFTAVVIGYNLHKSQSDEGSGRVRRTRLTSPHPQAIKCKCFHTDAQGILRHLPSNRLLLAITACKSINT